MFNLLRNFLYSNNIPQSKNITNIRRINFFGGPGAGKSVIAKYVASIFQRDGYNIEYISEYIKTMARQNLVPCSFDVIKILAEQMVMEDIPLRTGVQVIVSDSPIYMQCVYCKVYGGYLYEEMKALADRFEDIYPSFNIFLRRGNLPYETNGRYETYELAKQRDKAILKFLDRNNISYMSFDTTDWTAITSIIKHKLESQKSKVK